MTRLQIRALLAVVAAVAVPALAQDARPAAAEPRDADRAGDARPVEDLHIPLRMRVTVTQVDIQGATARDAFDWWSRTAGIPVLIDWSALRRDGLDPDQTIDVQLRAVRAGTLLGILMRQTQNEQATLIYETTPWFIEIMTKQQAARRTVTRVYDVQDLLFDIPQFTDAPSMDLRDALSNTNSGGGGAGIGGGVNGGGLFRPLGEQTGPAEMATTTAGRGEDLAGLVRETIEPDLWAANGGEGGSIRYFNGRLVIKAPLYVHRQIDPQHSQTGRVRGLVDGLILGDGAAPARRPTAGRGPTRRVDDPARATRGESTLAEVGQGVLERTSAVAAPPAAGRGADRGAAE